MCTNFTSCCKPLIKYHENLVNAISDVKSTSTRGNVLIRGHITSVSWRKGRNPVPDRNAGKTKRSSEALSLCTPSHEMKEQAAAGRRKRMDTATPTHCRARLQQGQGQMQPQKEEGGRAGGRRRKKKKTLASLGLTLSGLPSTRRERACREQDHPCPREASGAVLSLAAAPPLSKP